jgi:hypothetical protein
VVRKPRNRATVPGRSGDRCRSEMKRVSGTNRDRVLGPRSGPWVD